MAHKLRKQNRLLILAVFLTGFAQLSWAQPWTENFDDQTGSSYLSGFTCNISGTWTANQAGNFALGDARSPSSCVAINDNKSNAHLTMPDLNTCGTVSFYYYPRGGSAGDKFELQISENGSDFTTLETVEYGAAPETYVLYSYDVNSSATRVNIRILSDNADAHLIIDDFSVTTYPDGGGTNPTTGTSPWKYGSDGENIYYENKVGIGIDAPERNLEVAGSIAVGSGTAATHESEFIEIKALKSTWNLALENKTNGGFFIGQSGNKDYLFIGDNKNIGIGTFTPSARLDVNGTLKAARFELANNNFEVHSTGYVYARELIIQASGDFEFPDYVFAPDYKLRPLADVEQFIKLNSHLPEVPSAADVEANGIKTGEMNAVLLKKIEELTLYTIEQEKRLQEQQKQIDELKKLI